MLTEQDEKRFSSALEAAGWRSRDFNGVVLWTLRGFEGAWTIVEAVEHVCAGWAAQRLAALTKPFYLDWGFWSTVLASTGGLGTAIVSELVGSQNHLLSAAGMALAGAAPFISRFVSDQAKQAAANDIRPPPGLGAQPPPGVAVQPSGGVQPK